MTNPDVQTHVDADVRLGMRRLANFVGAMIPISLAYLGMFVMAAVAWRSTAMWGGAAAVVVYIAALLIGLRASRRGELSLAATITGSGLLAMIAIGAVFLHFQLATLAMISVAAVVVVLPHLTRTALVRFAAMAVVVLVEIIVLDGLMDPRFAQPPEWFRDVVVSSSLVAAAVLVIVMLGVDHERMRELLLESKANEADARRARDANTAFLQAAAHQLRTPVATVLLQSETLLRRDDGDPKTTVAVERLLRQAIRLRHVLDVMLDVSRASAGTLQLDNAPLDLSAVVREVVSRHAKAAEDAKVPLEVVVPDRLPVVGDAQRLALLTSNLLDNVIKHAAGNPATILLREEELDVVLAISDGGPGIDGVDNLFDRGAHLAADDRGGLGVGLWLVQRLSEAMGGTVEVTNKDGTTFIVRIPRQAT